MCIRDRDSAAEPLILINPEITDFGTTLNSYEEGCLSIPGVYLNVVRPSTIKLKFRDEMGRPRKMKADGLLARCIQHEMDHLNGILFVDRVTSKDELNKELIKEGLSLIHISEPTRPRLISYAVFCLKKKKPAICLIAC